MWEGDYSWFCFIQEKSLSPNIRCSWFQVRKTWKWPIPNYTDLSTTCKFILEAVSAAADSNIKITYWLRWVPWSWDTLGPGTLDCSACTWKNISSSNKIQRNYQGLKITVCVCAHLGQLMDNKMRKDPKRPTATSEDLGAKTVPGAKAGSAHAPCTQHHRRAGQTTQAPPPDPTPGHTSTSPHVRSSPTPALGS